MIETRAPGKLFIAGEYAVVEPGQPAVLVAVNRYISVRLAESHEAGRIRSSEYGRAPLVWVREPDGNAIAVEHRPLDYVLSAISTMEQLRAELGAAPRYFDLDISSELDDTSGRKFGLGSSAAVTTAVICAIDEFYDLGLTRTERFKLALLATIEVAPNASGGDLAATTFGGWIRYTSPDREALRLHRAVHGVARTLRSEEWAECTITRLPPPDALRLLVGWTGSPASTEQLVRSVRRPDEADPLVYDSFVAESRICVDALVESLESGGAGAIACLRRARRLLQRLEAASRMRIETEQLQALCDVAEQYEAAGKPSGAGGGDCGIALVGEADRTREILLGWEAHDIRHLNLSVHPAEGGVDEI
ncbi:phosphomevalonate kinase [Leucobacter sp. GX24907]